MARLWILPQKGMHYSPKKNPTEELGNSVMVVEGKRIPRNLVNIFCVLNVAGVKMTQLCITTDAEVARIISERIIKRQKISWSWLESQCITYNDLLSYAEIIVEIGGEFSGFLPEKSERKLKEMGFRV
jgi:hypothetical protein